MSWRRAAVYWAVALLLGVAWFAMEQRTLPGRVTLAPTPVPFSGLQLEADRLRTIVLASAEAEVVLERAEADVWRVAGPHAGRVPGGLVSALLDQLTASAPGEEVLAKSGDSAEFGLATPSLKIVCTQDGAEKIELWIGDRTPMGTASYAKLANRSSVFLVGLSLSYYADLLFEAARQPITSPDPPGAG